MTILPSGGCSDANGPTLARTWKTLCSLPSDVRNREFFALGVPAEPHLGGTRARARSARGAAGRQAHRRDRRGAGGVRAPGHRLLRPPAARELVSATVASSVQRRSASA